jgi:hypothetical protein
MATEADHIALANKNHDVLVHLLKDVDKFSEWVTVVAFYKAVQIVEAVFVNQHGRCCHGHQKRLDALKSHGYEEIFKHYRVLWNASSIARYLCDIEAKKSYAKFADYLAPEKVERAIVSRRLRGVECEAVSLLSPGGKASLKRFPT